jgi:hypothetical protein
MLAGNTNSTGHEKMAAVRLMTISGPKANQELAGAEDFSRAVYKTIRTAPNTRVVSQSITARLVDGSNSIIGCSIKKLISAAQTYASFTLALQHKVLHRPA